MSVALIRNVLLRILVDPNYVAKGSALTWVQLDTDLKIIADAIIELSSVPANTSGFEDWSAGTTYSTSPPSFVAYNGNIWKYINAIATSGNTPGADPFYWQLQSQGQFAHQQNTDQYLDYGGSFQSSAEDIYNFINSPRLQLTTWNASVQYHTGDAVLFGSMLYLANTDPVLGDNPGGNNDWTLQIVTPLAYSGPGSYSGIFQSITANYIGVVFDDLYSIVGDLSTTYELLDGSNGPWTGDKDAGEHSILHLDTITDNHGTVAYDITNGSLRFNDSTIIELQTRVIKNIFGYGVYDFQNGLIYTGMFSDNELAVDIPNRTLYGGASGNWKIYWKGDGTNIGDVRQLWGADPDGVEGIITQTFNGTTWDFRSAG